MLFLLLLQGFFAMLYTSHPLNVYRVYEDTPLYTAIQNYTKECEAFVKRVDAFVAEQNADSAVLDSSFTPFQYSLRALRFTAMKAPLFWNCDRFGNFTPKPGSKAAEAMKAIAIPTFDRYYEGTKEWNRQGQIGTLRFGTLGKTTFLALIATAGKEPLRLGDAQRLDMVSLERIKAEGTQRQRNYFEGLKNGSWLPEPIAHADVFYRSAALIVELNQMKKDPFAAIKRSWPARAAMHVVSRIVSATNKLG